MSSMSSQQQNAPTFLFDALYCEEQHWDDNNSNNNGEIIDNCLIEGEGESGPSIVTDLLWDYDEEELSVLLNKEKENEMYHGLESNPSFADCRSEAIEWMLKVIGYYSFSTLTAVLAVNFFDRFLYNFKSDKEKPWMTQLTAVACLSLAAKVEETEVPLLLDLQVEECKYVFESKTIQRMEILVLSTLQWRMNPVTPLSFLGFLAKRLALKNHLCDEFLKRCECLLLSLITDCRFMCHLPSALATATMLYVISNVEPCIGVDYHDQLVNILGINHKDKVEDCCRLIQEVTTSVDFKSSNKRKFGSFPCSPRGVMEISFSSDSSSSNGSWALASNTTAASVNSSPEPLHKKLKSHDAI